MNFYVITLFPDFFEPFTRESIVGRVVESGVVHINLIHLRGFGLGKHKQVDDTVYGGGDGMLLQCAPIFAAFESIEKNMLSSKPTAYSSESVQLPKKRVRRIFLTPQGKKFTQRTAERLAKYDELILLCGRYEGVDQRVRDELIDEEISIGDYVLTGGELPAMVIMDSVIRLLPGVLGKKESHQFDSFSKAFGGKREYPQYTKPSDFRGLKVPDVLLSGDHASIEGWRRGHLR